MLKIENVDIHGWEAAIRVMRNAMNSWEKSDSIFNAGFDSSGVIIGKNDLALMRKLVKDGSDHRKFMQFITVYLEITAPIYFLKEWDTYKVSPVSNSCSTMQSYKQRSPVLLNYEVLRNMYHAQSNYKLDEWREFGKWMETLPHAELITGGAECD